MIFEIQYVKNGWITKVGDGEDVSEVFVSENKDDSEESGHHNTVKSLLYDILEYIGPSCGKYSQKRIRIITIPGTDYEEDISDKYFSELLDTYSQAKSALASVLLFRSNSKLDMPKVDSWNDSEYHDIVKIANRMKKEQS